MKVLLTGATGFVGSRVLHRLMDGHTHQVVAALRHDYTGLPAGCDTTLIEGLTTSADWSVALNGVDVVIHLAARVHVMRESASDPLAEFRRVNVAGTLNLAQQAAAAGVRRFVYISSIGVNGNSTTWGHAFTADDTPNPHDPYSLSKYEAEMVLRQVSAETGMEVVIIRPPLIYGYGAPGNFGRLVKLVARAVPLPLASVRNRRSLMGLDNLVDFVLTCTHHLGAANETFLVSDGDDMSTPDLVRRMASAMDLPARLFPTPSIVIMILARIIGRRSIADRLCNSLQVDISKTYTLLGWKPPFTVDEGLRRAVNKQHSREAIV